MSTLTLKNLQGSYPDNKVAISAGHKLYAPGHVVQVKYGYYTSQTYTTSTSYTDLQSISITPASSTSLIYIQVNYHMAGKGVLNVKRDGSVLYTPSDLYMHWLNVSQGAWNSSSLRRPSSLLLMDSPSTTSSITYTTCIAAYNDPGAGFGVNELTSGQNYSIMTLMEIAQ